MKRIFAFLLALLTVVSLFSCTPAEEDETTGETGEETQADTAEETTPETEGEGEAEALRLHRYPMHEEPQTIYVTGTASVAYEQMMLSSLQGLSCRYTNEHIYLGSITDSGVSVMKEMKPDVNCTENVGDVKADVWSLVKHYYDAGYFDSYVLCSESNPESIDIAITLAGPLKAIVVEESIKAAVEEIGYKCAMDVSDKDDAWLRASEYWGQLRRDMAMHQNHGITDCLIDWAIYCGAYYANYDGYIIEECTAKYEFLDDNAIIFGYNHSLGETAFVASHAFNNASVVPTDYQRNLSVFRAFAQETMTQSRVEMTDEILEPGNVHTITFVYSDGDNMCFAAGHLTNYVTHPRQDDVPISYGVPAMSIDLTAPSLQNLYNIKNENQEFIMSLSGLGYSFPSQFTPEGRAQMTEELAEYMRRSDLKYMIMLDGKAWDETVVSDFTEHEGIEGIFYVQGESKPAQVLWTNGKPCVGERHSFTLGYDGVYNEMIRFLTRDSLPVDPTKQRSYSMYYVGAWCTGTDVVASLVDQLGENVDVVTPDVFMQRLIHNCKPAEE